MDHDPVSLWSRLQSQQRVGDLISGRVESYVAFGAFIDLGVQGVWGLVENPNFSSDGVRNDATAQP